MKRRNLFYLIFSLGISSGTILVDRLVTPMPEWLAVILIIFSAASLLIFIAKSRNARKKA